MGRVINRRPGRGLQLLLGALPFVVLAAVYLAASDARLSINPADKLLPSLQSFTEAIDRLAFQPDSRKGTYILWADTAASLLRLCLGLVIATGIGLSAGVAIGLLPMVRAAFAPLVAALSMVPPLAVLPILFIVFGLGELAKVTLIVIGITPFLMRDLSMSVAALPREQLVKAQTLGASTWQIATRVVLPQILPRLIGGLRLSLGPAWLFLISGEAIAATEGLGYRIFLVRRYLAMDVILPYVAWITLLAFMLDFLLRRLSRRAFDWMPEEQRQ
ncbi:ABC transporter permease [Pelagibius litoralis]|uniref:ABC transporter permease n=1 Tax=Pelagibius litoralis TaxID=374515 RepID=A0A967KF13_9PROT|nr:ABC transporter permease [Pelagibius litoralis]NIA69331.1 ABC transporter permease [Pelagibius litoralis]